MSLTSAVRCFCKVQWWQVVQATKQQRGPHHKAPSTVLRGFHVLTLGSRFLFTPCIVLTINLQNNFPVVPWISKVHFRKLQQCVFGEQQLPPKAVLPKTPCLFNDLCKRDSWIEMFSTSSDVDCYFCVLLYLTKDSVLYLWSRLSWKPASRKQNHRAKLSPFRDSLSNCLIVPFQSYVNQLLLIPCQQGVVYISRCFLCTVVFVWLLFIKLYLQTDFIDRTPDAQLAFVEVINLEVYLLCLPAPWMFIVCV